MRLPAALALLALHAALVGACARPVGPAPAAGAVTPAPSPGDDLAAVRAVVLATPSPGTRVELVEWRELDVRDGVVAPAAPGAGPAEALAVAVHRRCHRQVGWTTSREVARSSWYLLRGGRLEAFDHASFGADCRPAWHLVPAAEADLGVAQALTRYLAQRHPEGVPDLAEHLDRTTARLEAGRSERVRDALESADLEIARLEDRLDTGGLDEETRLADQEALDALRAARTRLERAVRARAGEDVAAPAAPEAPAPAGRERLLAPGAPEPRPATPAAP